MRHTDLLLQMNDKQHQYLAQGRDISKSVDRAVGFKQAVTQDAHIEAAPKICLTCSFHLKK